MYLSLLGTCRLRLVVAYESRIHEQLRQQAIDPDLFRGLYLEDARKLRDEIYARHGKGSQVATFRAVSRVPNATNRIRSSPRAPSTNREAERGGDLGA